jgi:ATP-dependent helicase/DNAse subunit B
VPSFSQYAPLLAGTFRELIGPAINDDGGSYNLSLGQPLLNQPLVQAGLLPLSFCLEGQSRTLFLSLLLSPFYQIWKPHVTGLAQADRLWRKESIDADLEALLNCLHQHNFPGLPLINPPGVRLETLLAAFRVREQRGADWVKALRLCWQVLGFPVISEPGEEGFYQHLLSILQELENDLNGSLLDGSQFYAWLKYLLTQTLVNEPGYEQAGIQILGLIEARGLAFDHLFLGGLSKGSLPQAVRTFPFLTPEERRSVQGATYKSQFEFAQGAFAHLKTTAPKMTLTRPEEEQGDPLPPSPFWPEVAEKTERNIWTVPGPAWTRTEWLKQTVQGIHHYPQPLPPDDLPATLPSPPPTLSVTALETFLACPFKFFAGQILGLNPLEEIIIGISPPERGEVLHTILALITKTIRQQEGYEKNSETLFPIIKQCVQMVIQGRYGDPYWLVEQRRLIGEGLGPGGLLGIWLEKEFTRREEGWRWEKEEISFPHLKLSSWSFPLKGRIDRIDYNSLSGEVCCWDYKTGHLPHSNDITKHFLAPQLPIYLWAVKKQPHYVSDPIKGLRAGYLGLRSEGEFSLQEPFKQSEDWERCLQEWEEVVKGAQKEIISGLFSADPKPEPKGSDQAACSYCPYKCLCVYWKKN